MADRCKHLDHVGISSFPNGGSVLKRRLRPVLAVTALLVGMSFAGPSSIPAAPLPAQVFCKECAPQWPFGGELCYSYDWTEVIYWCDANWDPVAQIYRCNDGMTPGT